ncbi:MAG: hypothetical protein CBR30_00225 [Dictyoglomus sp. NZ13-RE01]|nr:MAG: hypothetical protein CBR30_00225 [Dictyoglomus sp. NZ13-RE01]
MTLWWTKELNLRLKSHRYLRLELTISLLLTLIVVIFWPDTNFNLKTFSIPNLSLFMFTFQSIVLFYLSSLIASGNLPTEREYKIIDLAKYAPISIWDLVVGRFLNVFFYILFLLLLLLPLNILVNFSSMPFELRLTYFYPLVLLDSTIFISLGILWSTINNSTLNWSAHWISFLIFLFLPFMFPTLSPYLPLNNILWSCMAQRLITLDVRFTTSHLATIIIVYPLISFILLIVSGRRLKYWRKNNENISRDSRVTKESS